MQFFEAPSDFFGQFSAALEVFYGQGASYRRAKILHWIKISAHFPSF